MREDEPMWSRIKKKSRHRTGNRSDIMMRGAISHHYIPDLLAYLYEIQATGVLSVIHGKFKREIFVHQGVPTAVRSNLRMEQIGELLVAYKVMTRKELERTQETRKMSKQSFSAVAIQEGFLSQKDYFNYSRQLFLTIIARLYRLKEGDFRFEERELSREILAFRVSFPKLMAFGLRKITDDEQIRKMIGETTQVPYLTEHFSEDHEVVFTGPEQKVIKEIHSSRTIQDIISESRVEPHIVLQTLLILRYLKLIKMTVDFREEGLGEVIELNVSGDISPEFHKSLFDEPDVAGGLEGCVA